MLNEHKIRRFRGSQPGEVERFVRDATDAGIDSDGSLRTIINRAMAAGFPDPKVFEWRQAKRRGGQAQPKARPQAQATGGLRQTALNAGLRRFMKIF